jgi:hypothetical protein
VRVAEFFQTGRPAFHRVQENAGLTAKAGSSP